MRALPRTQIIGTPNLPISRTCLDLLVQETGIENWVPHSKGKALTNVQTKARRIWHKGSVLTWAPYLKSILYFALQTMTNDEREKMLYRPAMSEQQKKSSGTVSVVCFRTQCGMTPSRR